MCRVQRLLRWLRRLLLLLSLVRVLRLPPWTLLLLLSWTLLLTLLLHRRRQGRQKQSCV